MTKQLVIALVILAGCSDDRIEVIRISLQNTETYRYPTSVGDEEGAKIATQARHYRISEVRRDSSTKWDAVYLYQPAADYVGSDHAVIKVYKGSDGASPNTRITEVRFYFEIN